ncbi:MAG: glycosyltransferase family 2 protein [Clostridia bacterium]|nr:glycosyltransferase family 2 protein [Clostridia bacterium]
MISIIVPVYKVEPYLRQCVDSILGQTYRDIEVLLIDDGSPDRCGEICNEYEAKDGRVRVFHTENRGLSAARNLGLAEAKGEYIGFVDSDDWIEPDMYEVLLRRIEETGADISTCGFWIDFLNTSECSPCVEAVYNSVEAIKALISGDLRNQVMNKLWSRKAAMQLRFPEGRVYEDIFSVYKVLMQTNKVATVHQPLYRYRQRKGSIARTYPMKSLIDYWDAIHERYEVLRNAEDLEAELRKQCASAIARTWRWFYSVPKENRDYNHLADLHSFATKNYQLLGDQGWPFSLRLCILLAHSKTACSLRIANIINLLLWNLKFGHALWA